MPKEKYGENPRILVAPLDWGLGHATRCIPIIKELLENNCDVWLAGNETQRSLLNTEFPDLPFLFLPGYRVKYSKLRRGFSWKMLLQLPKFFSAARKENKWLTTMVKEYALDAVVSDSRMGLWSESVPTVFITHQLKIKTYWGEWTENVLQKIMYRWVNRFTECWVPDVEGEKNLAGALSHPDKKPRIPVHYIGGLSRFSVPSLTAANKDHLLVILSGPEPQRSLLENKIVNELAHYPKTATVLRGLPGDSYLIPSTNMIKFYNHLPAADLEQEIKKADRVISRSGYSTVMDMMKLQKRSILIPTPGQTEQEYLAKHLMKHQLAFCIAQKNFSITRAVKESVNFEYNIHSFDEPLRRKQVIRDFLSRIKNADGFFNRPGRW
jgi:uncharacterized protein (TIGR00661 family)